MTTRRRLSTSLVPLALICNGPAVNAQPEDTAPQDVDEIRVEGVRGGRPLDLDAPNATGSRLGLSARELPASISVVSQQEIQLRGARTALEAVEAAVGMTGSTGVGSIPSYATRGFAGADITIMRDGIRQNTSSQASRPLDTFLFGSVEVLKGPASLLYGEGAVGGAVNYVSKQAGEQAGGELLLSAGSWGRYRAAAGTGGRIGNDGPAYRADVSLSRDDGYVARNREDYKAAGGELQWTAGERTALRFSATALQDSIQSYYGTPLLYDAVIDLDGEMAVRPANAATDRLVNARIDPATRRLNYNNADNAVDATNTFWRLIVDTELNDSWTLRNETYAATQRLDWYNTERNVWNPATEMVDRGGSFFLIWRRDLQLGNRLDLSWNGELGGLANRFLIGMLYDRNDQDRNTGQAYARDPIPTSLPLTGFDPGVGPDASPEKTVNVLTRTAAFYVEDVLSLTDRFTLVGGLRYDRIDVERVSFVGAAPFTKSYSPFTGRLGLIYELAPRVDVYASFSSAAQPVSQLVSLNASHEDFSLQKGRQYEIGLKSTLMNGRTDMTVAVFDIEKNDLLTSTIVNGERINSQIGAQVSQGLEWALGMTLSDGWRLSANLAWNWTAEYAEFNQNLGDGVISRAGNTPPNVPERVASVGAWRDFADWSAGATLYHVGECQANPHNGIQIPAYTRLDASLTRRWDRLSATLRGRNLTDKAYVEGAGSGGLMWRLGDPRSVELGLRHEF